LEYHRFLVRSDNKAIKNAKVGTTMEYQQRGFDLQHFPSKENETSRFSFQETGTEETLQDPESEETLQLLLHDKPDETETSSHGRIGFLQYLSPFTTWPIRYLLRLACFSHFFCGAEGLRGTFPGYPRPPSLFFFFWTTQHEYNNTQHPWEAHPAWDSNPADLVVVSLFLPPPYRQSLINIHTHSWPGGGSFLRKNPPPSVGFEPTSAGTATSEHCLRQPCGQPYSKVG
jgi:hypothetical protein